MQRDWKHVPPHDSLHVQPWPGHVPLQLSAQVGQLGQVWSSQV